MSALAKKRPHDDGQPQLFRAIRRKIGAGDDDGDDIGAGDDDGDDDGADDGDDGRVVYVDPLVCIFMFRMHRSLYFNYTIFF